jgi:hypothetical protein
MGFLRKVKRPYSFSIVGFEHLCQIRRFKKSSFELVGATLKNTGKGSTCLPTLVKLSSIAQLTLLVESRHLAIFIVSLPVQK